jgi:hypothetical protein
MMYLLRMEYLTLVESNCEQSVEEDIWNFDRQCKTGLLQVV